MKKFSGENPNRDKTSAQLEKEAKDAINKTIKALQGSALLQINREIRKSFPFGPYAGEREKKIWQVQCFKAEAELKKWPQPPLAVAGLIAALVFSFSPVMADMVYPESTPEYRTVRMGDLPCIDSSEPIKKTPLITPAPPNPAYKKKVPFSVKHPHIHKAGRYTRKLCQVMQPIVSFSGSCAQIISIFK